MHQDSLLNNIFKNVKRKAAIQAKEKVSNKNEKEKEPLRNFKKENDIIKPVKLQREKEPFSKDINDNVELKEIPMKRKSRNKQNSEKELTEINREYEGFNKNDKFDKSNLEKIIEKRKKKEEEIKPLIQEAKLRLLNKNNKNEESNSITDDDSKNLINDANNKKNMLIDDSIENKSQENSKPIKRISNKNSNKEILELKKEKDLSDKTKNIVKNIMTRRKRARNEESNNLNNITITPDKESSLGTLQGKSKFDSKKNSADKTYMSSDVLDNYEENLMHKNKQKRNFLNLNNSTLSELALKDLMNNLSKKPEENLPFINHNHNSDNNNSISEKNESLSLEKDVKNLNNETNLNFKTPLGLNNNNKNLLLSCEANGNKKRDIEISSKTQMIINKLKEEKRENNFKRETKFKDSKRNKSESSFSLKFKYEELIKEERELNLPVKFKHLLNQFSHLDQTLNFFKLNNKQKKMPNFEVIKSSIEDTYRKNFEFETFLQILYVVPHFFIYSWEKLNDKNYNLHLGIPRDIEERISTKYSSNFNFISIQTKYDPMEKSMTQSILENRRNIFKNLLLEIVNYSHKKFLEDLKLNRTFNPFLAKTWHSAFDLEGVSDIPIFEIAEKPSIKILKIKDFLNDNDYKSDLIKKAIENSNLMNSSDNSVGNTNDIVLQELIPSKKDENENVKKNELSKYVSKELLNKIRMKERAIQVNNEIIQYNTTLTKEKNRLRDIKDLFDKIKSVFIFNQNKPIPINDLAGNIREGSNTISSTETIDSIKSKLYLINKIFPNWLIIKESSILGTIVRIEQNLDIKSEIMPKLETEEILNQF